MRKIFSVMMIAALFSAVISCQEQDIAQNGITQEIIDQLQAAGFNTSEGLLAKDGGYLVEYDIFLTPAQISELGSRMAVTSNGVEEHYRTTNLVTGTPRTISVYMDPAFDAYMQSAFDEALSRYNALNLTLSFQRTTSSRKADIQILTMYSLPSGGFVTLGQSAGFPSRRGNPASPIKLNTYVYNGTSQRADATTVIAHEIGHAIGFRHTDYMNRAFSCGSGGNEGDAGVGAIHIPGTPTAPENNSYMLACSNGTDRQFTAGDRTALTTVY